MFDLNVIIGDSDIAYLEQLSNYLMLSKYYHFSIQAFSDASKLKNYLSNYSTDILLVTQEIHQEINLTHHKCVIILLVNEQIDCNLMDFPMVYKFQKGKHLEKSIVKNYYVNCEKESINLKEKRCNLIGVYSPIGGAGKTSIAMGLARCYSKEGYKTLFLSLEDFSNLDTQNKDNMSDLIYFLKKKTKNINVKLEAILKIDEDSDVRYIPPVQQPEDMDELTIEDVGRFISYITQYGWYEKIIIDFTSNYSLKNKGLLKLCDHIILINNGYMNKNNKVYKYLNVISENENVFNKVILIENDNIMQCKSIEQSRKEVSITIPFCDDIHHNNQSDFNMNINTRFGLALGQIIEILGNTNE